METVDCRRVHDYSQTWFLNVTQLTKCHRMEKLRSDQGDVHNFINYALARLRELLMRKNI